MWGYYNCSYPCSLPSLCLVKWPTCLDSWKWQGKVSRRWWKWWQRTRVFMTQHVQTTWTSSSSSSVSNNLLHVPGISSAILYNTRRPIYIRTALVLEVYALTCQLCTLGQGCGSFSGCLYGCMETHVTYGFYGCVRKETYLWVTLWYGCNLWRPVRKQHWKYALD